MSFYQEEEQEQEEELVGWGFFVEIEPEIRDEPRYYNKRSKFITLDTIEEEYNYDLELDLDLELELDLEQSCFPYTKTNQTKANKTSCFNTFIPYLCILATLIYLQVL